MKYKAFKICFATKGYIRNKDGRDHKILGNAYYVLDNDFLIVKQFIQVKIATFRPTDAEMIKTSYYKRKNVCEIRKKFLESIQYNRGFPINNISKHKKIRIKLSEKEIKEINKLFLTQFKVKSSIDLLTGSNSSGAESNCLNTDIITYKNDNLENIPDGLNFTNPFNRPELFKKNKNVIINSLDDIELISINEYFNKVLTARKIFEGYNYTKYYIFNDFSADIKLDFTSEIIGKLSAESKLISLKGNDEIINFIRKIRSSIEDFTLLKLKKNTFINRLRNYQKMLIIFEKKSLIETHNIEDITYFNNFLKNDKDPNCEHSHIISVNYIIKNFYYDKEKLFAIADNYNCLLLPPSVHKSFDRNQIYFDAHGDCFSRDGKVIDGIKLKEEILDSRRIKYLKYYLEINAK